jgi:hypothetical protein
MAATGRRRWMREFMSNYRQNPEKREELRKAHRFDSFIWRLSKFLGPRYDILMCHQGGPFLFYDSENPSVEDTENNSDDGPGTHIFEAFPTFLIFYIVCEPGGGDVFKVFSYAKYYFYNSHIDAIWGMVGTLDKYALFNRLTRLARKERTIWENMIRKLEKEKERTDWREIELIDDVDADELHWKSQEWAPHDEPDWHSSQFQTFLRMWEVGHRKLGKREEGEWSNDGLKHRLVASPIFKAMRPLMMEARDRGSRP